MLRLPTTIRNAVAGYVMICITGLPILADAIVLKVFAFTAAPVGMMLASFPTEAFADNFSDAAALGNSDAASLRNNFHLPTVDQSTGDATFHGPMIEGLNASSGELFQQQQGSITDLSSHYGDNAAMAAAAAAASAGMLNPTDTSPTADAYRTLKNSATSHSHPNLKNDPVFALSEGVLNGTNPVMADITSGCVTSQIVTPGTTISTHVPDLQTCARPNLPTECVINRQINVSKTGNGCAPNEVVSNQYNGSGISAKVICGKITDDSFQVEITFSNPHFHHCTQYEGQTCGIFGCSTSSIGASCIQWSPPLDYTITKTYTLSTAISSADQWLIQWAHTIDAGVWDHYSPLCLAYSDRESCSLQLKAGSGCDPAGLCSYNFEYRQYEHDSGSLWPAEVQYFTLTSPRKLVLSEVITDEPSGCSTSSMCTPVWGCADASNTRVIEGYQITPDLATPTFLKPLYPGSATNPICYKARTTSYVCDPFNGQDFCYTPGQTDPNQAAIDAGTIDDENQLPDTTGAVCQSFSDVANTNQCATYEQDPSCSYVSSQCADPSAIDPATGQCLIFEDTYDCGFSDSYVGSANTQTTVTCPGSIKCMGTECVTQTPESNPDFGKALTQLSMINGIQMDQNCTGISSCQIFSGKPMKCRISFFGIVDCCGNAPAGISPTDYLKFGFNAWNLGQKTQALDDLYNSGYDVSGAWADFMLNNPTIEAVTQPLTSVFDSTIGRVTDMLPSPSMFSANIPVSDGIFSWVSDTFSPEIASSIFESTLDGYFLNIGQAFSQLYSYISIALTIYNLLMFLIEIIYACNDSEAELAGKKKMKLCHYVGKYCSKKTLFGICLQHKKSYCCFNSPLARILQEQGRPQLGMGWGSKKSPSCEGLTPSQLGSLNFNAIDLSEWMGMMGASNLIPKSASQADTAWSLDKATKLYNPSGQSTYNAAEATQNQFNQMAPNIDSVKDGVMQNVWGGI